MVPADPSSCRSDKLSDEECILKRKRNNDAVNRTREKKRREETDTVLRVEHLRKENAELEKKVEGLQKELSFLKEMFIAFATGSCPKSTTSEENDEAIRSNEEPGCSHSENI